MWAVKPVWDRRYKEYHMDVLRGQRVGGDFASLAQAGYVVFDNLYTAIGMVICQKLVPNWPDKKKDALLHWLTCEGGK